MTVAEILNELPKLTREERDEIRQRIVEIDGGYWEDDDDSLTDEEKAMIDARIRDLKEHPENAIPWSIVKERLQQRFGK